MTPRELRATLMNVFWALVFGLSMWTLINANIRQTRTNVPVEIEVLKPAGLRVMYSPPGQERTVTVSVQAPKSELDKQPNLRLRVAYDMRKDAPPAINQDQIVPLSKFRIVGAPAELRVLDDTFDPPTLTIRLAEVATTVLRVTPTLDQEGFPNSWELEYGIDPSSVRASGPKALLDPSLSIPTERIDVVQRLRLAGWKPTLPQSVELRSIEVDLESPPGRDEVTPQQKTVRVWLRAKPRPFTKEIEIQFTHLLCKLPGLAFRVKPDAGYETIKLLISGPEQLVGASDFPQRMRNHVFLVPPDEAAALKPGPLRLSVYVYPPPTITATEPGSTEPVIGVLKQKIDATLSPWPQDAEPGTSSGTEPR